MSVTIEENRSEPRVTKEPSVATVLIVDDDENFRDLAREILAPGGFRVIEAENMAQCLSRLRSQTVHAIILDIVMPDRDGLEGLQDLRGLAPHAKIVTVSGARNSDVYLDVAAHLGTDASLDKSKIASLCALLNLLLDAK